MDRRKRFQVKVYDLNGSDTFFSHFSTEFLDFAYICCCFHNVVLVYLFQFVVYQIILQQLKPSHFYKK